MSTSLNIHASPETLTDQGRVVLTKQVEQLGEWFHNIDLLGVATAPRHFLGDFPNIKWKHIERAIPADRSGATLLDVGCNGGFYSGEMQRRGARRVSAVEIDDACLNRARYAAAALAVD